jgi:uncharacterized SAM-binding protein YcdF (DUF218 family)
VADFVRFLFSIGAVLCALLGGLVWSFARPKSPAPRRFILALTVVYYVAAVYPISHGVARVLESGYRPLARSDVPPGRTVIVVLGSGSFTAHDWKENRVSMPDPDGADRVIEAARVYHLIDPEWIISSGGVVGMMDRGAPGGKVMADALVQLGVPAPRILLETASRTTRDEAVIIERMLKPLNADRVVLVTSDIHMRRSVGTFRAVGIDAVPAVARSPHFAAPWNIDLLPSESGLEETRAVMHELLGITYYALRGWFR